ncbi:MAG: hypothetical protein LBE17_10100 [Treponema sp.]|nr:hypothetical protein [Treponema sp.]
MKRFVPVIFLALLAAACKTPPPQNEYMTADTDPISAGSIAAGTQGPFSSRLRQTELLVTYHPRTDSVEFQFPYQTVTYRQYWNTLNREALLAAISQYQSDFAAKNLPVMRRSKMRRAYGTLEALTEWGSLRLMITARGRPAVELGYTFVQNSPYFIITQREAKNELVTGESQNTSLLITLFFTRAMAADLAAALDRSRLLSLLPDAPLPAGGPDGLSPDEY